MKSKIDKLFAEIEQKREDLYNEFLKLKKKYEFEFEKWKIKFSKKAREKNKLLKLPIISSKGIRLFKHILSAPFIYWMVIPIVFLDICLYIYQQWAFRLYWIPFVKRKDYIVYDRQHLDYLNFLDKFHCEYCSYVNWFLWYAVEVAWRTEAYWCPIKHAKKNKAYHSWQKTFADYWDPEWFEKEFVNNSKFN